jgi:hypothetical protein
MPLKGILSLAPSSLWALPLPWGEQLCSPAAVLCLIAMESAKHGLKTWVQINPSSLELFLSGICHSNENLTNAPGWRVCRLWSRVGWGGNRWTRQRPALMLPGGRSLRSSQDRLPKRWEMHREPEVQRVSPECWSARVEDHATWGGGFMKDM